MVGHEQAVRLEGQLYREKLARIHWATYSIVDCLSFVVMERLGIQEALAVDSDFTHRFVARPGPHRG